VECEVALALRLDYEPPEFEKSRSKNSPVGTSTVLDFCTPMPLKGPQPRHLRDSLWGVYPCCASRESPPAGRNVVSAPDLIWGWHCTDIRLRYD